MASLILALCLGISAGWFFDFSKWNSQAHSFATYVLLLMLFALGAKLGMDSSLHQHLLSLGARALVLAFSTIVGSLLGVYCLVSVIAKKMP